MKATQAQRLLASKKAAFTGLYGEQLAAEHLRRAGYHVIAVRDDKVQAGDLRVIHPDTGECIALEVKTARRAADGKWHFNLWKRNSQNHHKADMVLLLAALKTGQVVPFVIPIEAARDVGHINICNHPADYGGKWAVYRQSIQEITLEVEL